MLRGRVAAALAVLVILMAATATLAGATLEGHWSGAIEIPGAPLAIDLDFAPEQDGWTGDISIPAQGARDLPLTGVTVSGGAATFAIQGVPGDPTFRGTLAANGATLTGTFTQGGLEFPFSLARAATDAERDRDALADLDAVVEAALVDWKTPGLAVAVVSGGEVALARGYGQRDIAAGLPVTATTLFSIGSSTKAFTTFVMGQLADEGRLDWDEPVVTYLPEFRLRDEYAALHATPRDLLSHRTGLPRHDLVWYNDLTSTRAQLVEKLRWLEPNKELRESWQYNNLMYLTAGYLVERRTSKTWEEAVRERILDPLGMTHTVFDAQAAQAAADHAKPYIDSDGTLLAVPFRETAAMGPAGSIHSCADDLARWMLVHLSEGRAAGRQLISAGTLDELHAPQMVIPGTPEEPYLSMRSYALGWMVDDWRGRQRVHHGGAIDGFQALVTLFPKDGVGIAVLANRGGSPLPGLLTATIADRVLGLDPKPWLADAAAKRDAAKAFTDRGAADKGKYRVQGTEPSRAPTAYAGRYAHPAYGELRVVERDGRLTATLHDLELRLEHWHYDVFNVGKRKDAVVPDDIRLAFRGDASGRIVAVEAPLEPLASPIVFARLADARLSDPAFLERLAGDYDIPGARLTIAVRGAELILRVAGQPDYVLDPAIGDEAEFALRGVQGFSVRFAVPDLGPAAELVLIQPDGVYPAKRVGA